MTRQKMRGDVTPDPEKLAHIISQLQNLNGIVEAGLPDEAIRICEEALAILPDNVEIISILADLYWQKGNIDQTRKLLARGLELAPDNAQLHLRMGDLAKSQEQIDTAIDHYRQATRLDPGNIDGYFQYGALLARSERYAEAVSALQRALNIRFDVAEVHLLLAIIFQQEKRSILAHVHRRLHDHFNPAGPRQYPANQVLDTYFLDDQEALAVAQQGLLIQQGKESTNLRQICYHHGPLAETGVETLIHLPMNRIPAFFFDNSLRPPVTVQFDPADLQQTQMAMAIARTVDRSYTLRASAIQTTISLNSHCAPSFEPGKPLQVFLFATRTNETRLIEIQSIAHALQRLGCRVHFETEKNGMEILDTYHLLKAHYACNPHITFNINHANNTHLHEDVFNIVWYQDAPQEIRGHQPPHWRQRDIVLSASETLDKLLSDKGVHEIHRQYHCFDLAAFQTVTPPADRRKVVFIGDSHHHYLHCLPQEPVKSVARVLQEKVEQGEVVTDALLEALAQKSGLPALAVCQFVFPYVIRHCAITWLCELTTDLPWEVDIHGRFWKEIPEVAPFHRGELADAPAVAAVYNQARYALATHTRLMHTRRLAELSACGCIPVVYDHRPYVDPPHWEDALLYFRTRDTLRDCLHRQPRQDPSILAHTLSSDTLAQRILAWVKKELEESRP
ncbi:MAG: tetratricopeptide repeat protein [Magnetococcus sp. DMHC-1]|nr:tetratricopeptide repeat protein [Magnetococcales bacterium]